MRPPLSTDHPPVVLADRVPELESVGGADDSSVSAAVGPGGKAVDAFRDGEVKTTGTDIDKIMPPVSRFGGSGRAAKKQTVIEKLKAFFEKYFGIV